MTLIHYGADRFDPDKVKPVKNTRTPFTKPKCDTAFWTSPVDASYGWKEFCEDNDFRIPSLRQSFPVLLSVKARILEIDCEADLDKLTWIESRTDYNKLIFAGIDFEATAKDYDAIHLTTRGQWSTRLTRPRNLYGWDCETVLILNPGIIIAAD